MRSRNGCSEIREFQLADEVGVAAEREVGFDSPLDCSQPQLLQPGARSTRERRGGELGERRPAPQPDRLAQEVGGALWIAGGECEVALGHQALESVEIELVGVSSITYPGGRVTMSSPIRACRERFAQLRYTYLDGLCTASGGSSPHSSSISWSIETTRLAFKSRSARSAPRFSPAEGEPIAPGSRPRVAQGSGCRGPHSIRA